MKKKIGTKNPPFFFSPLVYHRFTSSWDLRHREEGETSRELFERVRVTHRFCHWHFGILGGFLLLYQKHTTHSFEAPFFGGGGVVLPRFIIRKLYPSNFSRKSTDILSNVSVRHSYSAATDQRRKLLGTKPNPIHLNIRCGIRSKHPDPWLGRHACRAKLPLNTNYSHTKNGTTKREKDPNNGPETSPICFWHLLLFENIWPALLFVKEEQAGSRKGFSHGNCYGNFAPCTKASLTKRLAFTNWRPGRDFHTKIVTEPYVCSLHHKETCIHWACREEMQYQQIGGGGGRKRFSHEIVTEPNVCSLYECKSHKETSIHWTHREVMKKQQIGGRKGISFLSSYPHSVMVLVTACFILALNTVTSRRSLLWHSVHNKLVDGRVTRLPPPSTTSHSMCAPCVAKTCAVRPVFYIDGRGAAGNRPNNFIERATKQMLPWAPETH